MKAIARLDWGRWLADCPNPACTNAMQLDPGQQEFRCRFLVDERRQLYGGCGAAAEITWPADVDGIDREFAEKDSSEQNWRPEAAE